MKHILKTLVLFLVTSPAFAGYVCDSANDRLKGTLTTQINPTTAGATIAATVDITHPSSALAIAAWGESTSSADLSGELRSLATQHQYGARTTTTGGTATAASATFNIDTGFHGLVATFTSNTRRDIYVDAIGNTGNDTTSNTMGTAWDSAQLCETLASGADNTSLSSIAEVAFWDIDLTDAEVTAYMTATAVPTFTAGPTLGTPTTTTLPYTFTSSYTGNVFGVACPDGQAAPSVAQVKLGQCTGGVAAVSAFTEAVVGTVSDANTFTGLTAGTVYDTHFVITRTNIIPTIQPSHLRGYWRLDTNNATQPNDGLDTTGDLTVTNATFTASQPNVTPDIAGIATVANSTTTANPAFDSISVSSQTTTAYTMAYDANAAATNIYCAIYPKDASTPTAAQIEAGTGARATSTEATTGSSDTIVLTDPATPPFYINDLYCVLKTGSTYTAVTDGDFLDEVLDIPTGKNRVTLISVDASSPYFGHGVAGGDTATIDQVTDPSLYTVTQDTDGTISYAAGGDTSRQFVESYVYDVSSPANLEFLFPFNDLPPTVGENWPFQEGSLFALNTNPNLDLNNSVFDPELDAITWAVNSGTFPIDWLLGAANGFVTDGTPGVCGNYTGTISATDPYSAITLIGFDINVGPNIPDVSGDDEATATTTLEATCSLTVVVGSPRASQSVPVGMVVDTDPDIGTLVFEDAEITLHLSSGPSAAGGALGLSSSLRTQRPPQGMRTY